MNWKTYDYNQTAERLPTDEVLTPTETAIAAGIACGLSGNEIAELNHVSRKTVITHTQNIYDKIGIKTRSVNALAVWFLEKNLKLDLSEIRRRAGAMMLLGLVMFQMAATDFDNQFVRARTTRASSARVTGARGRRNEDNNTFNLQ